jgi:hypothetical protein
MNNCIKMIGYTTVPNTVRIPLLEMLFSMVVTSLNVNND